MTKRPSFDELNDRELLVSVGRIMADLRGLLSKRGLDMDDSDIPDTQGENRPADPSDTEPEDAVSEPVSMTPRASVALRPVRRWGLPTCRCAARWTSPPTC